MFTRITIPVIALFALTAQGSDLGPGPPSAAAEHALGPTAPIEAYFEAPFPDDVLPITAPTAAKFDVDVPSITVVLLPQARAPAHEKAATAKAKSTSRRTSYTFSVPLTGHQAAIDTCAGFVWEDFGSYGNAVSAHNNCGGGVVLRLQVGDTVHLKGHGAGTYTVTRIMSVPKDSKASVLGGHIWMQTCYFSKPMLRLVRLTPSG